MNTIFDLDSLPGKHVLQAYALHDLEFGWLQQVIFQVEDVYLVIAVEGDTDEVSVSILSEIDPETLEQQFSKTSISNQRKKIVWLWRMVNQNGYEDGFQMEFDDRERTNIQLIAEASRLKLLIFQRHH
ncbi:DUF6334 family protein [Pontibacter sp. MBLB2868]|uniref:DUF6334 family protein n=1 Tax=Pontibacter sp. MBLB2868 TaxID=3451555 RepID=UPI003F74C247